MTEDYEDVWTIIDTLLDLSFAVAVCFTIATMVLTVLYFTGACR